MAEAQWGKKPVYSFSCCFAFISHNDLRVLTTGFGSKVVAFLWLLAACLVWYYGFWRLSSIWWIGPSWENAPLNYSQLGKCPIFYRMTPIVWLFWLYQDQKHSIFTQDNSCVRGRPTYVVSQWHMINWDSPLNVKWPNGWLKATELPSILMSVGTTIIK